MTDYEDFSNNMHLCAIRQCVLSAMCIKNCKTVYFDIMLILTAATAILHCQLWIIVLLQVLVE